MIDWTASMQQTFDFYIVNPANWRNETKLMTAMSCSINKDLSSELLESATIECEETLDECYVRIYLVCTQIQNGIPVKESFPLGTYLVQTPSTSYDGRLKKNSLEAYSPLIELKDSKPPYGYAVMKDADIMQMAYDLTRENCRAPVVEPGAVDAKYSKLQNNFLSDFDNDTWLVFLQDLIGNAKFNFSLDEMGRILFSPQQKLSSLRPIWTYTDDNSSIIKPDITFERDLYGVPNVVEVLYSTDTVKKFASVVNDDPNSPVSTVSRGRRVVHRVSNPNNLINPTDDQLTNYAEELLESLSTFEYSVTYKHGYCPVRVGDCVMLNYRRAGLEHVKAKVISQTIDCRTGCEVSEKAVYTQKLWEVGS